MTTLFDATLALSDLISPTLRSVATGGTQTTLVDTARSEPATYWIGGTIWLLGGAGLTGTSYRITGFDPATHTFTFDHATNWMGGVVAGVPYAAAPVDYSQWSLIAAVNYALASIGGPLISNETLTTVAEQREYSLPTGVSGVKRVSFIDPNDLSYNVQPSSHWVEQAGKLIFDDGFQPFVDSLKIHLDYQQAVTNLAADTDVLPNVHIDLVAWTAAIKLLRDRMGTTHNDEPWIIARLNEAIKNADAMLALHPVDVSRDAHMSRW